jgi:hypothetical protein
MGGTAIRTCQNTYRMHRSHLTNCDERREPIRSGSVAAALLLEEALAMPAGDFQVDGTLTL